MPLRGPSSVIVKEVLAMEAWIALFARSLLALLEECKPNAGNGRASYARSFGAIASSSFPCAATSGRLCLAPTLLHISPMSRKPR